MATEIAAASIGFVYDSFVHGTRFLALCTDSGYTETTDYSARGDLDAAMAADPTGNAGANESSIDFTFATGDTITHWAICDDPTDPISSSYLLRGPLPGGPITVGAGVTSVAIGDAVLTVQGA